jgi:archaellum component FlaC
MKQEPASKSDLALVKSDLNKAIDEVKSDLNDVKSDLNEVKADLNEVKGDLKNVKRDIEHLASQAARNQIDFIEYKEENSQKLDTILVSIDGLARLITDGQAEKAATESALRRHDNLLVDHATRIGVLEKKTA